MSGPPVMKFPEGEEFDVVVCGTGLKECILSGLLSVHGKKVLHVDRNNYYGGECASLNLTNLWDKFRPGQKPSPDLGANRDWNVDLVPKFIMSCGNLVKMLLHTKVTRYLEWHCVEGTYVYQYQAGGMFTSEKFIHKVPATDTEALKSPLMSILEKNRCKNFFQFAAKWDDNDKSTWKNFDPSRTTMREVYESFGLHTNTIDFIGHAVALYTNDGYLHRPMGETMEKVKLYMFSLTRYGSSPFIYPLYGLGGLPEGFSRLSAIHGGTYMLNKPIAGFEFGEDGKVCGVKATTGEVAKCKMVVCDPSYVTDLPKVRVTGRTVRVVCILTAPIPNTNNAASCQIIIPQSQLGRQSDVYVMMVSSQHQVCKQGFYIAIVSTTVESNNPLSEVEPALRLLGPIKEHFVSLSDVYEPIDDGAKDGVFVSESYDALSHFESATDDCLRMWKNITGQELDLNISTDPSELQE
uniref:Rab GDP dissociation inhibitor n=1 Tax=Chromera velia CCMP2878 TaxID=1169474 RepID=A0A0G4HAB3_9ALVE|mmetsp:Transcript_54208/g.106053  ORF Transcript_54208/g.106053 Transcript_54208/m.106053 type:complete len:465 (+) Transcript_54208:230-1624(+)|eukprot:Cvel_25665.t1-p1 / transcript=Cvel_25665.t1 / gene=Cvel_25665 / organism=Chromera_velia_CCMP2878 / gene_product=Rab GDP dissociation inhibitor alpha, putative / transcript_product=Rab GDP dissociation inhibitor alpha, putative / location=Cvel_scaffold2940:10730-17073(-) / protein_length=464 / sequence_SO=supercontig / SO=protein_coding / is_pseudo=false